MTKLEKLACVWMGRRLEAVRHSLNLTASEVATRMGMRADNYRQREMGRRPITLSFLCRAQLALCVPIGRLWFLFPLPVEIPDESTMEAALTELLEHTRPVTCGDVLEIACEVFLVHPAAVMSGMNQKRVNQARAAAALVVESTPCLKLTDLAVLVRRSPRNLVWSRRQAEKAGKDFWSKVAAVRQEVESL